MQNYKERASLFEESDNHKRIAEFACECLKTNEKMSNNENSNLLYIMFDYRLYFTGDRCDCISKTWV